MSQFSSKNSSTEGNVLTIKTVQIAPFRTLMTALKDILLETNISFQPDGIRIIDMDKSQHHLNNTTLLSFASNISLPHEDPERNPMEKLGGSLQACANN
jgi:hypothetical protein